MSTRKDFDKINKGHSSKRRCECYNCQSMMKTSTIMHYRRRPHDAKLDSRKNKVMTDGEYSRLIKVCNLTSSHFDELLKKAIKAYNLKEDEITQIRQCWIDFEPDNKHTNMLAHNDLGCGGTYCRFCIKQNGEKKYRYSTKSIYKRFKQIKRLAYLERTPPQILRSYACFMLELNGIIDLLYTKAYSNQISSEDFSKNT